MASVTKTLTWQTTEGNVDHYEIGISTAPTGTITILVVTTDTATSKTITYDDSTYNPAWLFIRAIADDGSASAWSDPVSADSLILLYTPPQPLQYAYANDVTDELSGITIPSTITTRMLNKACLAASRRIDALCKRRFSPQTVVERYDGTGMSELTVRHYPITKLHYVKVNDQSGLNLIREYSSTDLNISDWEIGSLILKPILVDSLTNDWSSVTSMLYGHVFLMGKRNIEVSYEYGHMFYVEAEELQYISSTTSGSSGITSRTYQAIHHNWAPNNYAIYQNGELLQTNLTINTTTGTITIAGGADDDTVTAYYYHVIPHDIELAAAKIAALDILNQVSAKSTGGVTGFRNMNYQETYGTKPYSSVIEQLQSSINSAVQRYQDWPMSAV